MRQHQKIKVIESHTVIPRFNIWVGSCSSLTTCRSDGFKKGLRHRIQRYGGVGVILLALVAMMLVTTGCLSRNRLPRSETIVSTQEAQITFYGSARYYLLSFKNKDGDVEYSTEELWKSSFNSNTYKYFKCSGNVIIKQNQRVIETIDVDRLRACWQVVGFEHVTPAWRVCAFRLENSGIVTVEVKGDLAKYVTKDRRWVLTTRYN
jgi:hypothetical protein